MAADIVGFQGVLYEEVLAQVRFSLQGEGSYEAALRTVPASGQLLEEPERMEWRRDQAPRSRQLP